MDIKRIWLVFLSLISAWTLSAQTYSIGDVYTAPDGSRGIVYYLYADGSGGWVVALTDASAGCLWGDDTDVPALANVNDSYNVLYRSDTAAYTNTRILRNYQNNSSYAAGVVDFEHGWTLPTLRQLRMLYSRQTFISTPLLNAGGTLLVDTDYYWCCLEYSSAKAWTVDFNMGGMSSSNKSTVRRVRAVRSFSYRQDDASSECTFLWSTGSTQTDITVNPMQTMDYSVTVTNANGCTGTESHIVTVFAPDTINENSVACDRYEWNGQVYTESGDYTKTFTNQHGCDSLVTLHLTVNHSMYHVTDTAVCGSYTWTAGTGDTYTESGTYTYNHTVEGGCPSVDTLHLTIRDSINVTVTASSDTICLGESVVLQAEADAPPATSSHVPPIAIGDILCTDNSIEKPSVWPVAGKTAMGIVFYVDNTGEHGWAVHLHNQGAGISWGNQGDIPGLTNYTEGRAAIYDSDGYDNTRIIRNRGNSSAYPAAWAVDFSNGWYLPAIGQLAILIAEIEAVDATLSIVGGTTFPSNNYFMLWSSTEKAAAFAWYIYNTGYVCCYAFKNNAPEINFLTRSVRSF